MMLQAVAIAAACAVPAGSTSAAPVAATGQAPVADKALDALSQRLFPLFTALSSDRAAVASFARQPVVSKLIAVRADRTASCKQEPFCAAQALMWREDEIAAIATALPRGLPAFDDGIAPQATRELHGVNMILGAYGLGQVSPYPAIDGGGSISPQERRTWLHAAQSMAQTPRAGSLQGLDTSFDFALALLDGSNRTDAAAFLPFGSGLNEPAFTRARQTDWSAHKYSALIVTGIGPELAEMPLSPGGKYHLRLAAQQFARGDAAFIIVTGGRAHPFNTPFVEAIEMRNALIERYGIPADRIVIEPHARHTTTNMRNAARLLIAMGAPLAQDTLVISNASQSAVIGSAEFVARNRRELGYAPGTAGIRLSPTALEWRLADASSRIDPRDPLDP